MGLVVFCSLYPEERSAIDNVEISQEGAEVGQEIGEDVAQEVVVWTGEYLFEWFIDSLK